MAGRPPRRLAEDNSGAMQPVQSVAVEFSIAAVAAQHPGDRPEQQDRVAILRSRASDRCVLGLLADGVGGRRGGAMASGQVQMIAEQLFADFQPGPEAGLAFFQSLIDEVSTVLGLSGMTAGLEPHSTLAAVLIQPDRIDCCHIGDSRIYVVRDHQLRYRSRDHTVAEALVESGRSPPERARLHPSATMLTQALGPREKPLGTFARLAPPLPGDRLLLCSDGLWSLVADDELTDLAGSAGSTMPLREVAETMIARARHRAEGRGDNCSLVLVALQAS